MITVIFGSGLSACAQSVLTNNAWQEDLDVFEQELEARHIDLFHTIDSKDFSGQIEDLRRRGESFSKHERRVALMGLTRKIDDGHTTVPLWADAIRKFPFEVKLIGDDALVTGTGAVNKDLLGAILMDVNGIPVSDIKTKIANVVPFVENAYSLRERTGMYLLVEDLLAGVGLIDDGQPATLAFKKDGVAYSKIVTSIDQVAFDNEIIHRITARHPEPYFNREKGGTESLWFGKNENGKTIYIQLDRYPSRQAIQAFSDAVLAQIQEKQSRNLIIDLRNNFGGDFYLGLQMASRLNLADSIDWENGVYVLIGDRTFSAAMSNAAQFRQVLNAKLIGSPTGGRPCGFQDLGQFELPNSSLTVTYSKRRFCFIDTTEDTIHPDYMVKTPIGDYLDSKDSVIEWVMQDIEHAEK